MVRRPYQVLSPHALFLLRETKHDPFYHVIRHILA